MLRSRVTADSTVLDALLRMRGEAFVDGQLVADIAGTDDGNLHGWILRICACPLDVFAVVKQDLLIAKPYDLRWSLSTVV